MWAALFAFLAVGSLPEVARGDPPLPVDEVRDRRLIKEERPPWRQALAFPNDAVLILAWPLKQFLCWAEHVRLDRRLRDVVLTPIDQHDGEDP